MGKISASSVKRKQKVHGRMEKNFTEINVSIAVRLGLGWRRRLGIFEAEELLQKVKSILINVKSEGKNLGL
jgi:hypothetical protein